MIRRNELLFALLLVVSSSVNQGAALSTSSNNGVSKNNNHPTDNLQHSAGISRRGAALVAVGSLASWCSVTSPATAAAVPQVEDARLNLLQAIKSSKSSDEAQVRDAIQQLVPLDPSRGRGATMADDLSGEWKLLWSAKADAFSPLLKLPRPFKPDSYQYLGSAASLEVGSGRVAQGLTGGILGPSLQLWLSSGVEPSAADPSILEIYPPFRFQVGGRYQTRRPKTTIVEAGSDAEFRQLNARTSEAQQAPKNSYQQLYLEPNGKGSLRISTITDGDPVIIGAIFIHQKL
jgi:hypothetical protein